MIAPQSLASRPLMQNRRNESSQVWRWASADYETALHKGLRNHILSWLTWKPRRLRTLGDIIGSCAISHQVDLGIRAIRLDAIRGSMGRSQDFDQGFMPRRRHTMQRWININRAYYMDEALPPVELMEVDGQYVVVDGHHRISVDRFHGQDYVEAHVVQVVTNCKGEAEDE